MNSRKSKISARVDLELNLSSEDIAAFRHKDTRMETGDYLKFLKKINALFPPDLSRRPVSEGEKFHL